MTVTTFTFSRATESNGIQGTCTTMLWSVVKVGLMLAGLLPKLTWEISPEILSEQHYPLAGFQRVHQAVAGRCGVISYFGDNRRGGHVVLFFTCGQHQNTSNAAKQQKANSVIYVFFHFSWLLKRVRHRASINLGLAVASGEGIGNLNVLELAGVIAASGVPFVTTPAS